MEGKEISIAASNQSCEKWILGRLSKKYSWVKKKSMHRKTGKVLSQFPTQLLLNTHLYNENTRRWTMFIMSGEEQDWFAGPVSGSGPAGLCIFYPQTSQKG